jgi:hypothetical protein
MSRTVGQLRVQETNLCANLSMTRRDGLKPNRCIRANANDRMLSAYVSTMTGDCPGQERRTSYET